MPRDDPTVRGSIRGQPRPLPQGIQAHITIVRAVPALIACHAPRAEGLLVQINHMT